MEGGLNGMSRRLYDVMENVGASETFRQMHQQASKINEVLDTIKMTIKSDKLVRAYRCGSSYEGSVTPATTSDIDIVYCMNQVFPLVADLAHAPPSLSLFMHRSDNTFPGYIKLHLLLDGRPITVADKDHLNGFEIDINGNFCFKHLNSSGEKALANGPADALFDKSGRHIFDNVFAFRGSEIPHFATGWIQDQTTFLWPSTEQTMKMNQAGCMAVGTGYANSFERDTEWRLSFTLQERQLVTCLNPVQHKVYILMKLIKEEFLNIDVVSEKITSYQCKTCVFYAARIYPEHIWTPDNLIGCVFTCMTIFLNMVRYQYCPNFFVKDQNLFAKRGYKQSKLYLQYILRSLLQEGPGFLSRLKTESIGQLLFGHGGSTVLKSTTRINDSVAAFRFTHLVRTIGNILACRRDIIKCAATPHLQSLMVTIDNVRSSDIFMDHSEEEINIVKTILAPWLHLQQAVKLSIQTLRCRIPKVRLQLMNKCDEHLQKAVATGYLGAFLLRATIWLRFHKYEQCLRLTRQLEEGLHQPVLHVCSCPDNPYETTPTPIHVQKAMFKYNTESFLQNHVASCIVFRPSESDIVPWPLRFEMLRSLGTIPDQRNNESCPWYDCAAVDAFVYLYFLKYVASSKLNRRTYKQTALKHLRELICKGTDLGHRDTAFNLLGWMYLQENDLEQGLSCFAESWKVRPKRNAAMFHVLCVWNKISSVE